MDAQFKQACLRNLRDMSFIGWISICLGLTGYYVAIMMMFLPLDYDLYDMLVPNSFGIIELSSLAIGIISARTRPGKAGLIIGAIGTVLWLLSYRRGYQ